MELEKELKELEQYIREKGGFHYKGHIECIDAMKTIGIAVHNILGSILRYVWRHFYVSDKEKREDALKIAHYGLMLMRELKGEE